MTDLLSFLQVCGFYGDVMLYAGTREAFRPFIRVKGLDLLLTTAQSVPWWDVEKDAPIMRSIITIIVLMLGASSPGYNLQLSANDLNTQEELHFPVTGWNKYYANSERKYADTLTAQNSAPNLSKLGKKRLIDDDKIWASD